MGAIASQITSLMIVYPIVYSDAGQRQHQSSASLAFVRGIHRWPVNSPHKWPVTRKMFPFDDVIMTSMWDVITHTCPYFKGGWVQPPSKLGHGWVIISYIKLWIELSIHALISVNVSKRGPAYVQASLFVPLWLFWFHLIQVRIYVVFLHQHSLGNGRTHQQFIHIKTLQNDIFSD